MFHDNYFSRNIFLHLAKLLRLKCSWTNNVKTGSKFTIKTSYDKILKIFIIVKQLLVEKEQFYEHRNAL
jgi:hypothetical protein